MTHLPPSERPRERCLEKGPSSLSLRECLALLLGSGPPGGGCLGLAKSILTKPGEGLPPEEEERAFFTAMELAGGSHLQGITGLGPAKIAQLLAAFELGRRYSNYRQGLQRRQPTSYASDIPLESLARVSTKLRCEAREWLGFVSYYRNGELSDLCVVEQGVRTHVNVDPAELFARLLALRPTGFVLFHNHPSGNTTPSPEDYHLTRTVETLAKQLGLKLLGHWIVSPRGEHWMKLD